MDDIEIDVEEFISRIRGNKPPYTCPFNTCNKICKSFSAIQKHMIHTHKDVKEKEICEIDFVNDENKNSQKSHGDHSPFQTNTTSKLITDVVQLSYADSKKFVILQNEKRSFRCNVNVPIYVSTFTSDSNKTVISEINTNTVHDENSNDTSQSDLSNANKKNLKRRRSILMKSLRKFRKLNNGDKDWSTNNDSHQDSFHEEIAAPIVAPVPIFTCDNAMKNFKKQVPDDVEGYVKHIEKSPEELNEIVEYDLDEEDMFWLPRCNEFLTSLNHKDTKKQSRGRPMKFKKPLISRETMEYVMDRFEKECHFESISGTNNNQNDVDEDAVCDVCLDGTCENSNVILFCDVCNLAVHQECYGVPYVPEGQWLCRKCFHSPSHPVECCLCPNKGGAFKQTDDGRWAHVVCGLWVPEVMFANLIFLEPIENIDKIESARWRLMCYLCKQKNVGACIQCHKSNCYTAFHVTCAQQAGLYMKIEQSERVSGAGGIRKSAFCDVHTPLGYIAGTSRGMYASPDEEVCPEKSFKRQQKLKDVRKLLTMRRNFSPPVCHPVIPAGRLREIVAEVEVGPHREQFAARIHAYWKLKRECKRGVPLLRRLVASSSKATVSLLGSMEEGSGEVIGNLKFWQQLRQDLEKARLLSELGKKREKLKRELFRNFVSLNEVLLRPVAGLLRSLLDRLQRLDEGGFFSEAVSDDVAPNYSRVIARPVDFSLMRRRLANHEYSLVGDVEDDFRLMMANCQRYNGRGTVYWAAAQRMGLESKPIFAEYLQKYDDMDIDRETGLFANRNIYDIVINSSSNEDIVGKLEAEIHRKVTKTSSTPSQKSNSPPKSVRRSSESQKEEPYPIKTRRQSQESYNTRSQVVKEECSNSVTMEGPADSQDSPVLRKMPATSSITINSISSSSKQRSYMNGSNRKSNFSRVSSTHTDPDSTYKCAPKNQCSQDSDQDKPANGDEDDDSYQHNSVNVFDSVDVSEEDDNEEDLCKPDHRLEPLDLVWAKCKGSSWFPGLIIDPYMSRDGVCDNTEPIPVPPDNVLELGRSQTLHPTFLILFFDKKRTWQWLEKDKLKPLGVNEKIDKKMLKLVKRSKRNKTIQRAYKEAMKHLCRVSSPVDECQSGEEDDCSVRSPL